ncbi:MAG: hypothetical protein DPW09_18215 [Anaerolineae bacterium]|nr:hypothetical protein [Anaerolineales bacterium]MCQ3975382.1 hypothetical protein [Anaerolineae bacterium]
MKTRIHSIIGFLATVLIATFFLASVVVELVGNEAEIALVKQMIVYGLWVLVPAMAITGLSGRAITGLRQGRLIQTKMRRMKLIALNGLLILLPCALVLNYRAAAGSFDLTFYLLQGVELAAGAVNIGLMGLNIRDGLRLTGRLGKKKRPMMSQQ